MKRDRIFLTSREWDAVTSWIAARMTESQQHQLVTVETTPDFIFVSTLATRTSQRVEHSFVRSTLNK